MTFSNAVILHIPHASTFVPDDEMDLFVLSREELSAENLKLADLHTDELYNFSGAARAVFPVSRFVVDAERFSDDTQEPMAAKGMGALYQVKTDLGPLRPVIPADRRERLMERYYWPHHNGLDAMALERLNRFGECLLVDCHSYPSKALPYEDPSLPRPQIGIGTDKFHTPPELRDEVARAFRDLGYEVGVDTPFSGALAPNAFYGKDARLKCFMIEVRRDLYMDEATGAQKPEFAKIRADLTLVMEQAAEKVLQSGLKPLVR